MSRAKKVDINQKAVVDAFRKLGASVALLHQVGAGFPDLLVGFAGENLLVEVKEGKKTLRKNQQDWADAWKGGPVTVVHNVDEVVALLYRAQQTMRSKRGKP
jgi:hypothetical protein